MTSAASVSRLGNWQQVAAAVSALCLTLQPLYVTLCDDMAYTPAFADRPGIGWMLYLPRTLTTQQVPEARALVPVMGKDERDQDRQVGTIIISVTDEAFSDQNPEHVKIANAIEVRLVDQDLLPRFADL